MSAQNAKNLSTAIPVVVAFSLVREASGTAQLVATVFIGLVTVGFIHVAAHSLWAPLFKRFGLWRNSLLLGCSLVAVVALLAGFKQEYLFGMRKVFLAAATSAVFFSWALAAMHAAQDGKAPGSPSSPSPAQSRLFRGRRRAHP